MERMICQRFSAFFNGKWSSSRELFHPTDHWVGNGWLTDWLPSGDYLLLPQLTMRRGGGCAAVGGGGSCGGGSALAEDGANCPTLLIGADDDDVVEGTLSIWCKHGADRRRQAVARGHCRLPLADATDRGAHLWHTFPLADSSLRWTVLREGSREKGPSGTCGVSSRWRVQGLNVRVSGRSVCSLHCCHCPPCAAQWQLCAAQTTAECCWGDTFWSVWKWWGWWRKGG